MSTMNARGKKPTPAAPQAAHSGTTTEELKPDLIRRRAYEIYLERKGGPGDHVSDWKQAERELTGGPRRLAGEGEARVPPPSTAPFSGGDSPKRHA